MISASSSGSGKTLVTCGLLKTLITRKMKTASFKCGPDYIDPMFHSRIIGAKSKNLDTFFTDDNITKYLLCESAREADISVIEGVMGYYDGMEASSANGSSYALAKLTRTPVILVVDCKGMSLSVVAEIEGFVNFFEDSGIKGVILNRMPKSLYNEMKQIIEDRTGVKVMGYLPSVPELIIESRHLGLVTPDEIDGLDEKLGKLAAIMEEALDIDGIIAMAADAPVIEYEDVRIPHVSGEPVIAVARDEAFCFYYEDNLKLLQKMGAKIIYFSPMRDKKVPDEADALMLGGGYPEVHAKILSENSSMLDSIKAATDGGLPCMAECGGFMYLHEAMEDMEGNVHKMAGVIKGKAYKTSKLGRFGYIKLTALENQFLGNKGDAIKGHEFHYFDSTNCGTSFLAEKPNGKKRWECIHGSTNMAAGFPHLYYYSNINVPYNFLEKVAEQKERQ
ncbi:hydrogenobyrinic acid a,c-diamide synthase (glutamine-hydrolysing) [Parasporobacterium paucivorans DSM 15970]|uniref:Cobyrinate a,c-diamide synthase n=2 Tax=Parasporobacterium TaxID=115543 RepID=A0A1M6DTW2_9FIRM|nr:hydrogenobyrinic acid a,c-diamide synthase (glutamine-hydrolysing) [Parasporobacterium paucivorans DSM 15970]